MTMDATPNTRVARRLPRVRVTIASLMIAVGLIGSLLGTGMERRARFLHLAEHHRSQVVGAEEVYAMGRDRICRHYWMDAKGNVVSPDRAAKDRWHSALSSKYSVAARSPWLPVDADPPEP
jgi:hypothetical protein